MSLAATRVKRSGSTTSSSTTSSGGHARSASSSSTGSAASALSGGGNVGESPLERTPPTPRVKRGLGKAEAYDYLFKILVLGDSSVGKTALSVRFAQHTFTDSYMSTIGLDLTKRVVAVNDVLCKLHIWDTAGQERFRTIVRAYYREAQGLLLVYDITKRSSFDNVKRWLTDVERHTAEHGQVINKVLIGNKADLSDRRAVTMSEGQALADNLNIPFFETSAKTDANVDLSFMKLGTDILQRLLTQAAAQNQGQPSPSTDGSNGVDLSKSSRGIKSCCGSS